MVMPPVAAPMPLAVRPSIPPPAVRAPVKVLAEAGASTQTPPSYLATPRTPAPPPTSLVSTEVTMFMSVFVPRSSRVLA